MTEKEEIIEKLKTMGFSEYASKAYLAIVQLGKASAPKIAEVSDVPKAKVYDVLNGLYKEGFIGKDEQEKVAEYFAYKPLEKIEDWLLQFKNLAEYLENMFGRGAPVNEYGFYSLGNYTEKLQASDFYYIFDQSDKLYETHVTGRISDYYRVKGNSHALIAVNKQEIVILVDRGNRVQYILIEDSVFYNTVDYLFNLTPVSRKITDEMLFLTVGEDVLYMDTLTSCSGYYSGVDGKIWLTASRVFLKFPEKEVYARPIKSLSTSEIQSDGSTSLVIIRKDGQREINSIYTNSDPKLLVNMVKFLKKYEDIIK